MSMMNNGPRGFRAGGQAVAERFFLAPRSSDATCPVNGF